VVAAGTGGHVSLAALTLCLLAGLSWGIGSVVSRAARAPGGLALVVWSATVVPVPLLGLSLAVDGTSATVHGLAHFGWHAVLSTLYTAGLCSLVGYAIFNRLLVRYPSGYVVPWVLLAPVVAIASAWALLGQVPGTAELAGAALLVAGVLIAQGVIRARRPARVPGSAPARGGLAAGQGGDLSERGTVAGRGVDLDGGDVEGQPAEPAQLL